MGRSVINFSLICLLASFCFASEDRSRSTTIKVEADPSKGFSYPYYLHVPPNVRDEKSKSRIHSLLVIPNNTGKISDDLSFHESNVKFKMFQVGIVFRKLNVPVLMPVFPRPKSEWKIYTHALDRDSLITEIKAYSRFDLQLAAMIKHAKDKLKIQKIRTEDRVLMYGFSASGMFVNRFTFLHPEIVKAAAIGSPGGWAIAPIEKYKQETIYYPIGVSDLALVSGKEFDLKRLRMVDLFLFLGDKDDNDSVVFRDGYETQDETLILKLFGKTPVSRWKVSEKLYSEMNLKAKFKLYPNAGHKVTKEMLKDVLSFLSKHKA